MPELLWRTNIVNESEVYGYLKAMQRNKAR